MSRVSVTESSFRRLLRKTSEEPRRLSVTHRGNVPEPSHIDSLSTALPPSIDPCRPTSRVRGRLCSQLCDVEHRRGPPRVSGPAARGARGGGDLFTRAASPSLAGTTLAESRIGEQTGLNVVAIEHNDAFKTDLKGDTTLPPDSHLVLIGSDQQMEAFVERY